MIEHCKTPEQIEQLEQKIALLNPIDYTVPPLLGQGFTNITVYNLGEFTTYDHAGQPDDTHRDELIELVEIWVE